MGQGRASTQQATYALVGGNAGAADDDALKGPGGVKEFGKVEVGRGRRRLHGGARNCLVGSQSVDVVGGKDWKAECFVPWLVCGCRMRCRRFGMFCWCCLSL